MRLFKLFFTSFVPGIAKPLHALWNELLAFIFFILTIMMVFGPVRGGLRGLRENSTNMLKFGFGLFLAIVFLGFGIYSYRRARQISRS